MVIKPGSLLQVMLGLLFALIYLVIQHQLGPYNTLTDNFVALTSSFSLVVLFLSCVVIKVQTLIDLDDVRSRLPDSLVDVFDLPTDLILALSFGAVVACLAAAALAVSLQLSEDHRRAQLESLQQKARRLRLTANDREVDPPLIGPGRYHLFLSHVWSTAQDQMRIVKARLREMIPDASVFLDVPRGDSNLRVPPDATGVAPMCVARRRALGSMLVPKPAVDPQHSQASGCHAAQVDDLEDISDLEGYIERTETVLIFCSKGYFQSKNCMREIRACTARRKAMIAVLDPESTTGAMTLDEVKRELLEADAMYGRWGFEGDDGQPDGMACIAQLLRAEPIEWNRIGAFQDVTMRLIAERLLPPDHGATYISGELIHKEVALPPPRGGYDYHLYVSPHNAGALEYVGELSAWIAARGAAAQAAHRRGSAGAVGASAPLHQKSKCNTSVGERSITSIGDGVEGRERLSVASVGAVAKFLKTAKDRRRSSQPGQGRQSIVRATTRLDCLDRCESMLCFLNGKTWTSGITSEVREEHAAACVEQAAPVGLIPCVRLLSCCCPHCNCRRPSSPFAAASLPRPLSAARPAADHSALTVCSQALAEDLATAMSRGISLTLMHEMPGIGGQAERHGVAFATFFASDATPLPLLKAGIYATIAVALKGGAWREASQVLATQALAVPPRRGPRKEVAFLASMRSDSARSECARPLPADTAEKLFAPRATIDAATDATGDGSRSYRNDGFDAAPPTEVPPSRRSLRSSERPLPSGNVSPTAAPDPAQQEITAAAVALAKQASLARLDQLRAPTASAAAALNGAKVTGYDSTMATSAAQRLSEAAPTEAPQSVPAPIEGSLEA